MGRLKINRKFKTPGLPPVRNATKRRKSAALRLAPTRAERNIAWCEKYLRIPEGKFVGRPLKMADFMKDDFRAIYDNPHGTRRAIISRGRKNAKTTESAMILLLHLCGPEATPNSQMFSAAQSRDQAAVLFSLGAKMVRLSPELSEVLVIRDTAKQLFCPEMGSLYRALSADASTALGLSPSLVIHDELGQVRGPRSSLYEALETATAAQENPLSIVISTQAPTDADLLSILIDDAGAGHDRRTVLRFQSAPPEMDPFTEDAIRAANPAFDVFMNRQEVLAMAEDAKRMPARQAEFENLVCNRRVAAEGHFIGPAVWASNGVEPDLSVFDRCPVYIGVDLSATQDLTAVVAVAVDENGIRHIRPWFFLPGEGLAERSRRDRVEYDLWAEKGFLIPIPGSKTIDEDFIAKLLAPILSKWDVRAVAYDRWQFESLRKAFDRVGYEPPFLEDFGQGYKTMTPALKATETVLLEGRARHGNHPVLTMCAANVRVATDDAGNRKLTKRRSTGRIDGMVALVMAEGAAMAKTQQPIDIMSLVA